MLTFQSYTAENIQQLLQFDTMPPEQLHAIRAVAEVYPFRVNSHVAEDLIDWSTIPDDPMFRLSFPQAGMLSGDDFRTMSDLVLAGADPQLIKQEARKIQLRQNPNPAG